MPWMSGSREAVAKGEYSQGPNPSRVNVQVAMEDDHILVYKNNAGKVLMAWDGAADFSDYKGLVL